MCLAIPMEILGIEGHEARCRHQGVERTVNLFLLADDPPAPGDRVLVHVGYAIQRLRPDEAEAMEATWRAMTRAGTDA